MGKNHLTDGEGESHDDSREYGVDQRDEDSSDNTLAEDRAQDEERSGHEERREKARHHPRHEPAS